MKREQTRSRELRVEFPLSDCFVRKRIVPYNVCVCSLSLCCSGRNHGCVVGVLQCVTQPRCALTRSVTLSLSLVARSGEKDERCSRTAKARRDEERARECWRSAQLRQAHAGGWGRKVAFRGRAQMQERVTQGRARGSTLKLMRWTWMELGRRE